MKTNIKLYSEAIFEATEESLLNDDRVILIGLGVNDPKGIFGTTLDLQKKFGFKVKIPIEKGIKDAIEYFNENK